MLYVYSYTQVSNLMNRMSIFIKNETRDYMTIFMYADLLFSDQIYMTTCLFFVLIMLMNLI